MIIHLITHRIFTCVLLIVLILIYPTHTGLSRNLSTSPEISKQDSLKNILKLEVNILETSIETVKQQHKLIQIQNKVYENSTPIAY